jgi:hypothetical protein
VLAEMIAVDSSGGMGATALLPSPRYSAAGPLKVSVYWGRVAGVPTYLLRPDPTKGRSGEHCLTSRDSAEL